MFGEPSCFSGIAGIKEFNYRAGRVHATGGVNPRSEPKTEIVCCHALAVSATGHIDQRAQSGIRRLGEILEAERDDRAVFAG